jgi:tetratricopeptide (TPR) repeat protein
MSVLNIGLKIPSIAWRERVVCVLALLAVLASVTGCYRRAPRTPEAIRRQAIDFLAEGQELERRGEYSLAINKYLQALELSPRPAVFYHLGHCYLENRDPERAVSYLREATARAQDFRLAQLELEKAEMLLKEQTKTVATKPKTVSKEEAVAAEPTPPPTPQPTPAIETSPAVAVSAATPTPPPTPSAPAKRMPPATEQRAIASAVVESSPRSAPKTDSERTVVAAAVTPVPPPSITPTPIPSPAPPVKPRVALPSREKVNEVLFPSLYGKEKESKQELSSDLQFIKEREVFLGSFGYHRAKAESYAANKNYDEAILEYQDALSFDPRSLESRLALADLYIKTDRLQRAEQTYLAALDLFPNDSKIYFKLANLYLQTGDNARAEINFQKATGLDPKNKAAHNNLGVVLMNTGRYTEAAESFNEALSLDPNYEDALLNEGILYERHLKEQVSEWIKAIESSLSR